MIPHYRKNIPFIDINQMRLVDEMMVNDYGISLLQMMENAGLNLAMLANKLFLGNNPVGKTVYVLAGSGGNGGGALAAARRLKNWGADVRLILTSDPFLFKNETGKQFATLERMNISVVEKIENGDLIIDGMIGYGVVGNLKSRVIEIINEVTQKEIPVLSLDAPSGLDLTTGKPGNPNIKADATMTLALPKTGLFKIGASKYIGNLYLADISVPPQIYKSFNIDPGPFEDIFRESPVVKINKLVVFS